MILLCLALTYASCGASRLISTSTSAPDESKIFYDPEQQPCYLNGGVKGLLNDLYTSLSETATIAQECITARAVVSFAISKEGQIEPGSIKVISNRFVPDDYLKAAIEAIKNLGKFEPGKMNGTPVRVTYCLPVRYPVPAEYIPGSE